MFETVDTRKMPADNAQHGAFSNNTQRLHPPDGKPKAHQMQTIFLDNFRGFARTYVDLLDVNFFVGENSTGKTSLLWVLRLLSDSNFWFTLNFEIDDEPLGQFSDLVSANNSKVKRFALGLALSKSKKKADDFAVLFVFGERNGMPQLERCMFQRGQRCVLGEATTVGRRRTWSAVEPPSVADDRHPFDAWLEYSPQEKKPITAMKSFPSAPFGVELASALMAAKHLEQPNVKLSQKQLQEEMFAVPILYEGESLAWIAPIRMKPKRTYDEYKLEFSAEGQHTPYLVKRLLSTKRQASRFVAFLNKFGTDSGLFKSVDVRRFGRGPSSPFELTVVLDSAALGLHNVGYGVSQSLPIAVEAFARTVGAVFFVQQPEVHVHPRGQAALGELVLHSAVEDSKRFFVETHSDYLIDRFRMKLKSARQKPDSQIVFFERKNGCNVAHPMRIADDGTIAGLQPDGYRKFFVNEALRVVDLG